MATDSVANSKTRKPLSKPKKFMFSMIVLISCVAVAEIACKLLGVGKKEEVAWYIANWETQWGGQFYVMHSARPEINQEGLRDRDHPLEKNPETTRIVCLGDSVTFGHRVAVRETYPSMLESSLNKGMPADSPPRAEVFNVGLPGWSIRQERIAYRQLVRK